jgi:acetoin utilization protein AcuA
VERLLSGKTPRPPRTITLDAPGGPLIIRSLCPPGSFSHLELDRGLGSFPHYSSIIQKLAVFERIASSEDGNVILAIEGERLVVGYAACYYPEPRERWAGLGKLMYEMGAIEVSRGYRHLHIAQRLAELSVDFEFFEDKMAYMNGFSWHWDLDGTGFTLAQYRKMMVNLLKPYGFREYPTNEPNIAMREENVFLARIGSRVGSRDQRRFRNLLFGIPDDA